MGNPSYPGAEDLNNETNVIMRGIGMNHSTWRTSLGNKTVYFIRHAEAEHNIGSPPDYTLPDPRLTSTGVQQAQRIRDAIPLDALANVQLIVTSPMQRAIQTCLYAFRSQIDWGNVQVEVLADLQETSLLPCDVGSSREQLREIFPELDKELAGLAEGWQRKSACDCQPEAVKERSKRVLKWLMNRPERVIVCITHNGLLHRLLGDDLWTEHGERPTGFANGEVRRLVLQPTNYDTSGKQLDGELGLTKAGVMTIDRTFSHEIAEIGHLD